MHIYILFLLFLVTSCAGPVYQAPPPPIVKQQKPVVTPTPPLPKEMLGEDRSWLQKKGNRYVVVVDPGHGGDDFGAHSNGKPVYHEKNLNLATANMLKTYLEQNGIDVIMTRQDDVFIALDKRAEFANRMKPTLFVSVHYNSAPSKDADGVEVFYYRSETDKKRTRESRILAKAVCDQVILTTKANSRGVKNGNFAVIRETNMPAILIEGGFLTNDKEMEKIKDPNYMKKIAWGISQGIKTYLKQ